MIAGALLGAVLLTPTVAMAQAPAAKPKLAPDAIPVMAAPDYLRTSPAPDFWLLQPFYQGQETSSACSVASVAMAVNGLRGLPPGAEDELVTQGGLIEAVGDPDWAARTVEGGDGVTFDQLVEAAGKGVAAFGVEDVAIESFQPRDGSDATLAELRRLLTSNERTDDDVLVAYFNQGVLTGDWDGPHVSPIGAFDAAADRVLVMDVDRQWYVPYWTPVRKLLDAMLKPAGPEHGPLAGATGGLLRLSAPER